MKVAPSNDCGRASKEKRRAELFASTGTTGLDSLPDGFGVKSNFFNQFCSIYRTLPFKSSIPICSPEFKLHFECASSPGDNWAAHPKDPEIDRQCQPRSLRQRSHHNSVETHPVASPDDVHLAVNLRRG